MSVKIQVIIKSDRDEAGVAKAKLEQKGFHVTVTEAKQVILDGTDLGGHLDYLIDIDEKIYMVVGEI